MVCVVNAEVEPPLDVMLPAHWCLQRTEASAAEATGTAATAPIAVPALW
jgi:hypothetical protein